ncbi:MAG: polyprenyl synthetase family protein [Desulfobacteraceae bacterium]|jgi:octaprenyl-diphosphate synthase
MTDLKQKILTAVAPDLRAIEAALADNLHPHFKLVGEVAGHILFAGGKRLRPLLMVLAARLCGYKGEHTSKYAVIFEYLHAATLLHDDVVDGGELRRGSPAAHHAWDPPTAVLTGDFLLARALSLAADTGLSEVIRTIAAITEQMSQGEIEQLNRKGDVTLDEAAYREVIRCKTAVLFQGACRTGALISASPNEQVQALSDYGYHLGMAFQMADDLLDYTVDSEILGKRVGADLREGKLTLPVIRAMGRAGDEERQWIMKLFAARTFTPDQFDRLIALLRDHGGIEYTRQCAVEHIRKAKSVLEILPESAEREVLFDVSDYALVRSV